MQQYVTWASSTGVVQQFYTDTSIQVSFTYVYPNHIYTLLGPVCLM